MSEMPKFNREGQALVLSKDQLFEIFEELPETHREIAQVCYYTASRAGEIVGLKTGAIIQGRLMIRQSKVKKTKDVAIGPELKAVLNEVKPKDGYLFPRGPRGAKSKVPHMTMRGFEKALQKTLDYLGIRGASTHSFRRSMATHLYRAGVDLESIRQLTGHKSLGTLTNYIDIGREEAERKIADAISNPDFGQ